jgi:hypothetical protein
MTKDVALRLALEALEVEQTVYFRTKLPVPEYLIKAITAIKETLEIKDEYERGFIDGMQKQMQSSVDKAVNAMTHPTYYIPSKDQREWVELTSKEIKAIAKANEVILTGKMWVFIGDLIDKLKEKNT